MGTDMFFTQLFTSQRGPLAKVWLAAHWERKLTKAHVFDCNLEASIQVIISSKVKMGLRTCGHLVLGVVRIYNKKVAYLISDCNDALLKMKTAFRPGETDLPVEALEATLDAITLIEDFTAFDTQLPPPSDIDVIDHFSLNQSRREDITLKEDFGTDILTLTSIGNKPILHTLDNMSFNSQGDSLGDGFGDEGRFFDLVDFLSISNECSNFMLEEPQNTSPQNSTVTDEQDADIQDPDTRETSATNETCLLIEENAFALEPVMGTPHAEKNSLKRKRKLIVDVNKQLSKDAIRDQLSDYSALTSLLDIAPHTEMLMHCKESGGVDVLFAQTCSAVISPLIKKLFARSIFKMECRSLSEGVEEMRHDSPEVPLELSTVTSDNVTQVWSPSSTGGGDNTELTVSFNEVNNNQFENSLEGNISEVFHPELPSEDSMFVHLSHSEPPSTSLHTQSVLDSQDVEERNITKRTHNLLDALKKSGHTTFTLATLCEGSVRSEAAATFASLLILSKERALRLHQDAPYQDIRATPGPTFYH